MVDPELFARYQRALGTNADLVKRAVEELLGRMDGLTRSEQSDVLMAVYPKLVKAYGKVAADVARQYYQESRDRWYEETDEDVSDYYAQTAAPIRDEWANEDVQSAMRDGLGYLPKIAVRRTMQRADETIALNVRRDSARGRWAIVPHPGACGWCVMVASNGWAYSERSVNAQRHDGCKCSVAVDFDRDDPSLAGYDPDELRRQYTQGIDDAGGEEVIRAKWDALSPEEQAKYRRKGRSAYDTFKTQQIARAMDARSKPEEPRRFTSGLEANEYFRADTNALREHEAAGNAFMHWTEDSGAINLYARGEYDRLMPSQFKIAAQHTTTMDSWIASRELPDRITVFRVMPRESYERHVDGGLYHDDGYTATSCLFSAVEGDDPDSSVWLEIEVPEGSDRGAYINGVSAHEDGEYEFLLYRGADLDIMGKYIDAEGRTTIRARLRI